MTHSHTKQEKLDWLRDNTWFKRFTVDEKPNFNFEHHANLGRRIVCAVDNGGFIAVVVATNAKELEYYCEPDGRPKAWYTMDVGTIKQFAPNWKDYEKDLK